jgi:hypothetical protein
LSRHNLKARPEAGHILRAVVGWDRPLQTFFVQVFTPGDEDDPADPDAGEIFIWLGTEPGEIPTPEAAIATVAPFAVVPDDLAAQLRDDMARSIGQSDGPYQAAMKQRIYGSLH